MKKLILIIVAVLGMGIAAQAQNANRSGAFIELSGGYIVGDSPLVDVNTSSSIVGDSYVTQEVYEYLSGVTLQLSAGYRWAFASHWALEGKVGFYLPAGEMDFFTLKIGPGLRYTSKELGNSNSSIYLGLNPNFIYSTFGAINFGYEIQAGVNITPKFSIGLIWNANMLEEAYTYDICHTGSIGLSLGYRF